MKCKITKIKPVTIAGKTFRNKGQYSLRVNGKFLGAGNKKWINKWKKKVGCK